jgi:nicotinate-nucleotide adenylyltransferase
VCSQDVMRETEGTEALRVFRSHPRLRLGIMGGTFDPIHVGHLVTADEALHQFQLDEILFMPTGHAPHKSAQAASAEARFLMVAVATSSHPHFWVSRQEIDKTEVAYTVDTLATLRAQLADDAELFFITGADAVLDILSWKDPEGILARCTLIAATRPGYDLSRVHETLAALTNHENVVIMEIPALAVSSSLIRERLAEGRSVDYLVPEGVAGMIRKMNLYCAAGADEAE